ncbi:MAG: serine--tRNA ligase [Candidatus Eremiobacterota bacterium]
MIDVKLICEKTDFVKEELAKLNTYAPVDDIVVLNAKRREFTYEVERLKEKRNSTSKQIGKMKDKEEREKLIVEMREVGDKIKELDEEIKKVEEELAEKLLLVPNLPHESVPVGKDDTENIIVRTEGEKKNFDFKPLPHWEIGEKLGIIDFERGVKLSGTRFYVLKKGGSKLQRALINWMLDVHTEYHGYTEIYPPYMVKGECLVGTGNLPKFGENLYRDAEEDLWFIPTAEVPVTNLHREEILEGETLPLNYVAYTACFRREKMSAGKDTRGIKRGHQFDKVELVKVVPGEKSMEELDKLVGDAEDILKRLGLTYRVIKMCTGDLSFTAMIKYDLEVWSPGCDEWLEVSSCSNFGDFQARRAGIRYRPEPKGKPVFAHTLNGSAMALPRTVIAILENYQQSDGTVLVPDVLKPYMRGMEKLEP